MYTCGVLPCGASHKESVCQCRRLERRRFDPWVGKIPWRKSWQPTSVFLPGGSTLAMDREAWQAIVHGVTKSHTRLQQFRMHACVYMYM